METERYLVITRGARGDRGNARYLVVTRNLPAGRRAKASTATPSTLQQEKIRAARRGRSALSSTKKSGSTRSRRPIALNLDVVTDLVPLQASLVARRLNLVSFTWNAACAAIAVR
jgi:hypothetical protein